MKRNSFYLSVIALIIFILWQSGNVIHHTREAIIMCYEFIIPGLFPFFVCSGLLIYSGFATVCAKYAQPVMRPVFNVAPTGAAAFVIGIVSGFPSGAICARDLYKSGNLSKAEAERLLAFCNNSGPLFIIGTLGVCIFTKPVYGVMLYIIHIISSIIVGVIFSHHSKDKHNSPPTRINSRDMTIPEAFGTALSESAKSILTVCFSVIFFSSVSRTILDLIPLSGTINALIYGICEFSTGALGITSLDIDVCYKLILCSVIVGFSGICVHMQVIAVTAQSGLSLKPYILGKCLHSIIAAVITTATLFILPSFRNTITISEISLSKSYAFSALLLGVSLAIVVSLALLLRNRRASPAR